MVEHQAVGFGLEVGGNTVPSTRPVPGLLHGVDGALALEVLLCPEQASPWLPHPVPTDVALIPRKHHFPS
jgi:hypothetical protein